ncbi:hypothetical protein A6768_11545 [Sphingobium yanoikuyae]|uniref:Uncharacterized protein n=2 Tax=Sphingobium yanoikuyae TaxID=13690 RepID=A0A291N7C6_SPHYA|nr:hypothetical protein A6768_11545 [Sphingobium yanoikuyae]
MPRGTYQASVGVLLGGDGFYPILREDDGGQWRLDMPARYYHLLGRRVRVTGQRCDFGMVDANRIEEAWR